MNATLSVSTLIKSILNLLFLKFKSIRTLLYTPTEIQNLLSLNATPILNNCF